MMALLAAAVLSLTACGSKENNTEQNAEQTSEDAVEQESEGTAEGTYKQVSYKDLTSTIISLGQYKGLEMERMVEEVTDEDVQKEIKEIQKEYAQAVTVERPAQMGDVTIIDFTGYVDGETSDSLQGTEFSLELGSGQFVPGFEEQLVGASAGDTVEVNVTFPEEYYEDMAGKDARFDVYVQEVQGYELLDWGDEFIRENLEYDSEADMEACIRQELEDAAEEEADSNLEYELMLSVLDASEFQIQDADVEAYIQEMLGEYQIYASMYGVELGEFLQTYLNMTEEQLREAYRETAVFRVKMILALHEIAALENIEVSDEECTEKMENLAAEYGYTDTSAVEAVYSKDMIREQLIQEKAIDLIRENAVVS